MATHLLDRTLAQQDIIDASTPALVQTYTEIKVRVARHECLTPDVAGHFGPLKWVVDELRKRGVLN